MAKLENMRGLQVFISKIRNCKNKDEEQTTIDKELGKVRQKFASGKTITEYDRKKYVWKLLYIYMLGYDVEFGHKQAADLIPVNKYAEKQVGYMACAILLNEKDEFLRLVINSIKNDLTSRNEAFHCLALGFVGSVGGTEMASLLINDVMNLLTNGAVRTIVRKKAALCLLRLLRKSPSDHEIMQPEVWSVKLGALFEERDVGMLMALVTLLLGVVSRSYEGFESLVPRVVNLLSRLVKKDVGADYHYYGIPSPWLQVKCLRVLQYFPPPEDPAVARQLHQNLRQIITAVEGGSKQNVNKSNAHHAIIFEAVALALATEADEEILGQAVALLAKFINVREPNIKYLGLENMVRLAEIPAVNDVISRQQKSITIALKDADVSIRRRAVDLLFTMCSTGNVKDVVNELLNYLEVADFSMREELVLKTAILAERFYPDLQWYVDVSLILIERGGDYASKEIWHSIVQLVTNYPQLHGYAASKAVEGLQRGASHDTFVSAAGYIIGEYGHELKDVPASQQFKLLHQRFVAASSETKALLLTAYLKISVAHPEDKELKSTIEGVYSRYASFLDVELQQRAVEYRSLEQQPAVAQRNLSAMPPWEKRKSLLLRRFAKREGGDDADEAQAKPSWTQEDDEDSGTPSARTETMTPIRAAPSAPSAPPQQEPAILDILSLDDESPALNGGAHPQSQANGSAAAQPIDPMAELMGLNSGAPAASPANGYRTNPGTSQQRDPFAMSSPATDYSAGPTSPTEVQVAGNIQDWYRNLVLSSSGVLYEDSNLQLGVKMQFQGPSGQAVLFFGNKTDGNLERLVVNVPPTQQFELQLQPLPNSIAARKQVQISLTVACLSPSLQPPRLQLSYTHQGQTCQQTLVLPITINKFLSSPPDSLPREAFFSRWRALTGPPLKLSERVVRTVPLQTQAIRDLMTKLNLGLQTGLDADPDNVVAVSTFVYGASHAPMQVSVMVRIEAEKVQRLQFQVTVASSDNTTTSAVKELICQHLIKL